MRFRPRRGEDSEPDDKIHRPLATSDDHTARRTISRSAVSRGTSTPAQAVASRQRSRTLHGDELRDDADTPRPQHKAKEHPSQHLAAIGTSTTKENAATATTGPLRTEGLVNPSGAHTKWRGSNHVEGPTAMTGPLRTEGLVNPSGAHTKWRGSNHVEGPENPTGVPDTGIEQQTTEPPKAAMAMIAPLRTDGPLNPAGTHARQSHAAPTKKRITQSTAPHPAAEFSCQAAGQQGQPSVQ
mmetsp:Transcript_10786/g.28296  ORF Transcript_10786/g.28296 Transcript_10786/m.28296 type:complete len:240 (+) Transcript_10786:107-826(+)